MSRSQSIPTPYRWLNVDLIEPKCSTEPVLIESQWLTTELIDALAEQQCNWISSLSSNWKLEIDCSCLPGVDSQGLKSSCYTTQELIAIVRQAVDPALLSEEIDANYTTCLQIVGLGRVRLAVWFEQAGNQDIAFITNRLDWSPRKILAQWFRYRFVQGSESALLS